MTGEAGHSSKELAQLVARHLRRNEFVEAQGISKNLIALDGSYVGMVLLERAFAKAGRLDLLLDVLLSASSAAPDRLALIGETLKLGQNLNRQQEIPRWISSPNGARTRWTSVDYLKKLLPRQHALAPTLLQLKYPDLPQFQSAADLIAYAEKIADRIAIDSRFLDYLYRHSSFAQLPRDDWEKHVRTAFCIDHITSDVETDSGWHVVVDPEASSNALRQLDPAKGTLLITTHGGFTKLIISWVKHVVPDFIPVVSEKKTTVQTPKQADRVYAKDDSRAALFALYRALEDKRTVLMAPDARIGALNSFINVLGVALPLAEGAAFLAFESRCNTAWAVVVRQGDRFVPVIVPAPGRVSGENFASFKERLLRFYESQIEALVTGDPDNIVVKRGWVEALKTANA